MVYYVTRGSFDKTQRFLQNLSKLNIDAVLNANGQKGVAALAAATPQDSGRAKASWGFEVSSKGGVHKIVWTNSDIEHGFPVVIMLQYGHGTGTGGFVQGRDFINPAIRPVFDQIANEVWRAVISA